MSCRSTAIDRKLFFLSNLFLFCSYFPVNEAVMFYDYYCRFVDLFITPPLQYVRARQAYAQDCKAHLYLSLHLALILMASRVLGEG